jgi:two-component system, chemotaxis family, chemotaxis protein CheY
MIDLKDELAQDYLADCREHLASIETDLLAKAVGDAASGENWLDRVYRGVHFIWGGAAFFDLMKIRELSHKMEQNLNHLRSQSAAITPKQIRILISATDKLSELIRNPAVSNQTNIQVNIDDLDEQVPKSPSSSDSVQAMALNPQRNVDKSLRILLAEDDLACRLLLQTFLSRYGECHIAVNGKEAVEAFRISIEREQAYDMICMDIMMPEMDGREAVRRIRAIEEASGTLSTNGVKVIMTTTIDDVKEVIHCFQELCDAYLMKPIDLADLVEQMKRYQLIQ